MMNRKNFQGYNFGPLPDDHLSVKELVETAIKVWGNGEWKDISDAYEPHEAGLLKLDIETCAKRIKLATKIKCATSY